MQKQNFENEKGALIIDFLKSIIWIVLGGTEKLIKRLYKKHFKMSKK